MTERTFIRAMRMICAAAAMALLLAGQALAHKINIFGTVQGNEIRGECYSAGGGRPKNCPVELLAPDGRKIGETRTDEEGKFAFPVTEKGDLVLSIDTGDGHKATYTIKAAEFSAAVITSTTLAAPQEEEAPPASEPESRTVPVLEARQVAPPVEPPPDAAQRVGEEVARQIAPLREQMKMWEDTMRMRDIIGAVGYILGVAGLIVMIRRRRPPA